MIERSQVTRDAIETADTLQHHRPTDGDAHNGHDAHADHSTHAGHSPDMFRDKFWLSLLLSIPVVLWSGMVREWMEDLLGFATPTFTGSDLIPPILGTIIFVLGNRSGRSRLQATEPERDGPIGGRTGRSPAT